MCDGRVLIGGKGRLSAARCPGYKHKDWGLVARRYPKRESAECDTLNNDTDRIVILHVERVCVVFFNSNPFYLNCWSRYLYHTLGRRRNDTTTVPLAKGIAIRLLDCRVWFSSHGTEAGLLHAISAQRNGPRHMKKSQASPRASLHAILQKLE